MDDKFYPPTELFAEISVKRLKELDPESIDIVKDMAVKNQEKMNELALKSAEAKASVFGLRIVRHHETYCVVTQQEENLIGMFTNAIELDIFFDALKNFTIAVAIEQVDFSGFTPDVAEKINKLNIERSMGAVNFIREIVAVLNERGIDTPLINKAIKVVDEGKLDPTIFSEYVN